MNCELLIADGVPRCITHHALRLTFDASRLTHQLLMDGLRIADC